MSLRSEWNAIAARIGALIEASHVYLASLAPRSDDPYGGADKALIPEACRVFEELTRFLERHKSSLPPAAAGALDSFLVEGKEYFRTEAVAGFQGIKALIPRLAALRAAVDYHLRDFTAYACRITERAFLHLQRSIVADPTVQSKWQEAFHNGEVACERLGSAHLLLHGVWAFKAYAVGERTDLILGEPVPDLGQVEAVADALVLTEWKRITSVAQIESAAEAARKQATLYGVGSLAGIELATYRYIVIVSESRVEVPLDVGEAGAIYRHVNIAVEPKSPSQK
jgi:hypothetical protein